MDRCAIGIILYYYVYYNKLITLYRIYNSIHRNHPRELCVHDDLIPIRYFLFVKLKYLLNILAQYIVGRLHYVFYSKSITIYS